MMYVPLGFAHGFVVLSDITDFMYKCTDYYPESEQGIAWDDPEININWPISNVQLSDKDCSNQNLDQQSIDRLPTYNDFALVKEA